MFCVFQQILWLFERKAVFFQKTAPIRHRANWAFWDGLALFFWSKPPIFGHISEVSFDCGCIKIIDILIFTMENRTVFFLFLLNHLIFEKTELKWALRQFSDESDEKVARKKAYRLKLEFQPIGFLACHFFVTFIRK